MCNGNVKGSGHVEYCYHEFSARERKRSKWYTVGGGDMHSKRLPRSNNNDDDHNNDENGDGSCNDYKTILITMMITS